MATSAGVRSPNESWGRCESRDGAGGGWRYRAGVGIRESIKKWAWPTPTPRGATLPRGHSGQLRRGRKARVPIRDVRFQFGGFASQLDDPIGTLGAGVRNSSCEVRHRFGRAGHPGCEQEKTFHFFELHMRDFRVPAAHNPLVLGSNPSRPTKFSWLIDSCANLGSFSAEPMIRNVVGQDVPSRHRGRT
jgi:hypothetical protein